MEKGILTEAEFKALSQKDQIEYLSKLEEFTKACKVSAASDEVLPKMDMKMFWRLKMNIVMIDAAGLGWFELPANSTPVKPQGFEKNKCSCARSVHRFII